MALLGSLYGITSERKLAQECRLNLAFMWFWGYDLDETPPDHSILSKARVRLGREVYEQFFRHVVQVCQDRGLVQGEKVFIDATIIQANASLDFLVERGVGHQLQTTPEEYLDEVWRENRSGEVESLEEDNNFDSDGSAREKSCREPRPKDRQTNKRWTSRTDPDASLITRKGWLKPILAHKVHIAVDG